MSTLFVKDLTVIDFSYLHTELGLLGESWSVDIELDGSLDHQGMVLDFGDVKKQVKALIDEAFDHRLLLPRRFQGCAVSTENHRSEVRFLATNGEYLLHRSPISAIAELDTAEVTEQSLAEEIVSRIKPHLPDNVEDLRIHLHAEAINGPWYRYSHGLKHHGGNCQRIAHGHRSKITVIRNDQEDAALQEQWANRLKDIYIATSSDLIETINREDLEYLRFGYTANQGLFELELPKDRCYLIETDSTVENLAEHFAEAIKLDYPNDAIRVVAYEGIGKGAIGNA